MAFTEEVGIDLGTANVLVYIKGKGIVLNEPSVVAINRDTDEILAVGRFFRPKIMVCVPSGVTEVEKRAVREAATQAGGKTVYLMEEPVAAAIGAGIDISKPDGTMVIDIGLSLIHI